MFRLLSNDERVKIASVLQNEGRFGMLTDGERMWVLKHNGNPDSEKRDLLGFLLGKDFGNIAEVKLLTEQELENIKQFVTRPDALSVNNTFLVRLAHSYSAEELPCKTIEEAVATELVYSVWIRRRDAHIDNRVYVKGIPIFFDFHVAFLGETEIADINVFFSQTQDYGRAGLWRVEVWHSFLGQFTGAIHPNAIGAFHFVNNMVYFYQQVEKSKTVLKEKVANQIESCIRQVRFESTKEMEIINFLKKNTETLDDDVDKMLEIIKHN